MILEVELQERLFDTDFISLWEDVEIRQGSTDCLPPKPVALPLLV